MALRLHTRLIQLHGQADGTDEKMTHHVAGHQADAQLLLAATCRYLPRLRAE